MGGEAKGKRAAMATVADGRSAVTARVEVVSGRVGLAEVIDLAVAVERDRGGQPGELAARDAAIGARLRESGVDAEDRRALVAGWVAAVRER
ncbi:MAG: hypothetical protein AAF823_12005, partial [Planctomycetota bacterium]